MSGGGSGGGSSGVKYDNLEKLYGIQQQAAGFMLDQAMPRIPGILNNTEQMVGDAMSGALADQMRGRAAYDANQSIASSNNDAIRKLTSYGAAGDPSGGRFADVMNQNAFNSAKVRAGSMNTANNYAEDQKWNRNAGMYGQVSGMSTGAMQGMSSAGAGLSNLTAQQNQNAAANAQGFGQFGAAAGAAMTKANGGYIRKRRAPGLATGGDAWQAYKAANPGATGGGSRRGYGMGQAAMQILGGASPHLLGAGVKDVLKGDKSAILKAGKSAADWIKGVSGTSGQMSSAPASAGLEFETGPQAADIVSGNIDAASAFGAGFDATGAPAGITYGGDIGADGVSGAASGIDGAASGAGAAVDGVSAASSGADAVASAGSWADAFGNGVSLLTMANGGMARKKGCGLRFALGGGVRSPIAANGVDNMDASMSMPRVSQMDDKPSGLPSQAQQAAVDTRYMGKTDGMGETSAGDPDGFGKEGPDNRHMAGKATMSVIGRWLGGPLGGLAGSALAEVVHPVGEAVSRGAITTGDKAGGVSGAILMDPIGTSASGKYKPEDIAKGNLAIAAGVPWAGKFFSEGGDVEPTQRADYTPGGAVRGPGTETSDDIPAWLSDGEVVHNADAVKLAGKDAMLAINDAGLQAREGKASPEEAQQAIGKVMVQRGQQLLQGRRKVGGLKFAGGGCANGGKKYGLKLAGGGMLGNLGIALGAGVDQYNKQQQIDQRQQAIDMQREANARAGDEHAWKVADRKIQDGLRTELGDIENKAALGDTNAYMDGKQDEARASAALSGVEYQPLSEEQRKVIASTPGLGRMTPTMRYEMDMQRAAAYRKAGDAKTGEAYAEKATQRASGDAIQALLAKDARTFGKLYHVFPNGDTPDATEFDTEGNIVFTRGGQNETVKRKDAILSALALHDPKTAASMFQNGELVQERLDNWMKAQEATARLREQQMEDRNNIAMAKIIAGSGGRGSSSSKSGGAKDAVSGGVGLKDSDRMTIYDKSIPDDGFGGKISKADAIAQSSGRLNGMKALNPDLDDHQLVDASIEATKYHNETPTRGKVDLVSDGKGGFYPAMTMQEVTGDRTIRLGQSIPYEQLSSKAEAFKKRGIVMPSSDMMGRARIEWIAESAAEAEKVAKRFSELTPQQINNMPPEQRKRMQNAGAEAERLRNILQSESYGEIESRRNLGRAPTPAVSISNKKPVGGLFTPTKEQATENRARLSNAIGTVVDKVKSMEPNFGYN